MYLGINYYAAAVGRDAGREEPNGIDFGMIGLVAPLLVLSYTAYKAASSRIEDSLRHIGEVEHFYRAAVETLAIAVDAKDQVTHGHIRRVQRHTVTLARVLGHHATRSSSRRSKQRRCCTTSASSPFRITC